MENVMESVPAKGRIFSSTEAMEYLGYDWPTFRYHVYRRKHLVPDYKKGNSLIFRQETLDAFKALHQNKTGYTIDEAAKYLNVRRSWIRHHLFSTKLLVPDAKDGLKFRFSKETLDAMKMFLPPPDMQRTE
jgi:excisionase family DNA binding protein